MKCKFEAQMSFDELSDSIRFDFLVTRTIRLETLTNFIQIKKDFQLLLTQKFNEKNSKNERIKLATGRFGMKKFLFKFFEDKKVVKYLVYCSLGVLESDENQSYLFKS